MIVRVKLGLRLYRCKRQKKLQYEGDTKRLEFLKGSPCNLFLLCCEEPQKDTERICGDRRS